MFEHDTRGGGHGRRASPRVVHENLDTSYVNLAALVRYLQGRDFTGRIHAQLQECEGDIFLRAGETPHARETDHARACEEEGSAAFKRLLVRAGEPGGLVSIYEGTSEEAASAGAGEQVASGAAARKVGDAGGPDEEDEWRGLLELVAAVERGVSLAGGDFVAAFYAARAEMADDYPFLDPVDGRFGYDGDGLLRFRGRVSAAMLVSGVGESLRRVVGRLTATGREPDVLRGRVALELSVLARRRQSALQRFKITPHLERIAGVRLL